METNNVQRRRNQLKRNKLRGKLAEEFVKASLPLEGRIAISSGHHGYDIKAKRVGPALRNPLTGKSEPDVKLVEVKSPNAKLSRLQRHTQQKNKDRYEVRRPPILY